MLMRKPNKVRQKLNNGQCVIGSAIYSCSPAMVEAAGYAGIDFLRIDTEHSWRRDDSLENMIRAATIADVVPIVRVDRDDPYVIRKALESGAGGIVVPQILSVEDAENVVKASKFPPRGTRGFALLCQSGEWGARSGSEWKEWSDTEPMIGVMIESVKVMPCVDDILALDGLDFVLFGPADYSLSLGLDGPDTQHPKVQEALRRTIEAAKKVGKHVMFGVGKDEDMKKAAEMGVTMLEFAHDVVIFRTVLADKVKKYQHSTGPRIHWGRF